MDIFGTMDVSASGLKAQSDRLRIISQNIANAESTGTRPGEQPYRRKTIAFKDSLDRELGLEKVKVSRYGTDKSDFQKKYDPTHPAADEEGYVLMPNVNPIVEMMDMREARRGYEANLSVIETSKSMLTQTIGLLRQ